jgi:hypothetical protein
MTTNRCRDCGTPLGGNATICQSCQLYGPPSPQQLTCLSAVPAPGGTGPGHRPRGRAAALMTAAEEEVIIMQAATAITAAGTYLQPVTGAAAASVDRVVRTAGLTTFRGAAAVERLILAGRLKRVTAQPVSRAGKARRVAVAAVAVVRVADEAAAPARAAYRPSADGAGGVEAGK